MTTQSPDQSNSQSQGEEIDRIADKWAKLEIPSNKAYVPFMRDRYRAAITEAIESLSQSPAASKDVEELAEKCAEKCLKANVRWRDLGGVMKNIILEALHVAQEMGQTALAAEREAEVSTLRAELADRWRDITANEQQTQRLLNDIENLRAEIAELKVELEAERIITTRLQGEIQRLKL